MWCTLFKNTSYCKKTKKIQNILLLGIKYLILIIADYSHAEKGEDQFFETLPMYNNQLKTTHIYIQNVPKKRINENGRK